MLGTTRRSAGGCQLLIRYDCEGEKFMAINVYFVRHGQTYLNLYHRMPRVVRFTADRKGAG